jgi:hypothetical protein
MIDSMRSQIATNSSGLVETAGVTGKNRKRLEPKPTGRRHGNVGDGTETRNRVDGAVPPY